MQKKHLIFLFAFLSVIFPLIWLRGDYLFVTEESGFTNYQNLFEKNLFSWNEKLNYGFPSSPSDHTVLIPNAIFYKLLSEVGLNNHFIQIVFLQFFLFSSLISVSYLLRLFTKNNSAVLAGSLLYIFNFYFTSTIFYSAKMYQMILMPLFFSFLYKFLKTKKYEYAIYNFICLFLLQAIFCNLPQLATTLAVYVIAIIIFVSSEKINLTNFLKKYALRLCVFFVLLAPIFFYHGLIYYNSMLANFDEIKEAATFKALNSPLSLVFQLRGAWWEYVGFENIPYNHWLFFYDNPLVILRSFILVIILVSSLLIEKNKKITNIVLFIFFLIAILFASGSSFMPGIYLWFYEKIPFFYIFREPFSKFMPLVLFLMVILLTVSLDNIYKNLRKNKKLFITCVFIFISIGGIPFFSPNFFDHANKGWKKSFIKLPEYWNEYSLWSKESKNSFILPFPFLTENSQLEYKWYDTDLGNSNLKIYQTFGSSNYIGDYYGSPLILYDRVLKAFKEKKSVDFIKLGSVNYLLDQNDIDKNKVKELISWEPEIKKYFWESPLKGFGDKLFIYQIKPDYFFPHFYIPQNTIYSPNEIEILPDIVGFDDYEIRSAVFVADNALNADNADREDTDKADEEGADKADKRARITQIEGADEIFVKGENKKDIEKILNQVQDDGEGEIFYPHVKHEPGSLKWEAALLKEKYDKWQARKEPEKLIEKHLFYANKRIKELKEFYTDNADKKNTDNALNADNADEENADKADRKNTDNTDIGADKADRKNTDNTDKKRITLIEMWEKDLEEAIGLLEKIQDEEKRTEWAIKIKKTIADNAEKIADNADRKNTDNTDIGADNADGKTLAEQVDRLNQSLDRYIPKLDITKREYEIEIPRKGNYSLFINELTNSRIEELKNWELEIDGEKIADNALNADNADIKNADNADREDADNADRGADKADRNANNTDGGWRECGEINLEEGKHVLTLGFGEIPNLINADIVADNADRKTDNADGGVAIAEWRNNQWYQVKGKLIEKTKIGQEKIIIEQKDKEEEEKKEEAEWKEIKMYQPNENEFTFYFKSGDSSELGRLVLENITLKDFENLSVRPVWESEIVLRSKNADIKNADNADRKDTDKADEESADEKTRIPKITFVKINPTKYRIKVEGAKEPYTLVFSESFHEGWRLYADNADKENTDKADEEDADNTDYGEIVASYFDGQIKEGTHRNTFLEPATFETWGKEPIAQDNHLLVNGYANSWYITPDDVDGAENYELIVEFWPQRLFYIGLFISGLTLVGCLGYLGYETIKKRN